jgi:hypothetical protein
MCELRDAVVAQYSLFDLKAERIKNADGTPFDSLAHLNHCVAIEQAIPDDGDSDLRFIDRVSQCIAGFHDTHFWTSPPVAIPPVFAGIYISPINGKYYISKTISDLLNYEAITLADPDAQKELQAALAIGNEVTEVDGQKPADLAAHYKSYISGSSDAYVQSQAEEAIFYRNFDYPTQNYVAIKTTDTKGGTHALELPWWGGIGAHVRADANAYFAKLGIPLSDRVKVVVSEMTGKPDWRSVSLQTTGYDNSKALYKDEFNPLVEYLDDSGMPGLRVGEAATDGGKAFCYLELLTFETEKFKAADGSTKSFGDALRDFISDCESKKLDLVIDLRSNPGGNGDFPDLLLSLISKPKTTLLAPVMDLRVTQDIGRLLASDNFQPDLAIKDFGKVANNPLDEFERAAAAGESETNIIPNIPLPADPKSGGYDGNVIALVTPNCISACDMTAALLKKSGRAAAIIGTQSNGTGAGFYSSDSLDSTFKDSNDELAVQGQLSSGEQRDSGELTLRSDDGRFES